MANLGTLWFGADIDLTELERKIKQGNREVLDALKIGYDPQSYRAMVDDLKARIASEKFEIKLTGDTQGLQQLLNNLNKSGRGSGIAPFDLSNIEKANQNIEGIKGGIIDLSRKILDQRAAVKSASDLVTNLRDRWREAVSVSGRKSDDALGAYEIYSSAKKRLQEEKQALFALEQTRARAILTLREQTLASKEAEKAAKKLAEEERKLSGLGIRSNDPGLQNMQNALDSILQKLSKVREDMDLYRHAIGAGNKESIDFGQKGLKEAEAQAESLMRQYTALYEAMQRLRAGGNEREAIGFVHSNKELEKLNEAYRTGTSELQKLAKAEDEAAKAQQRAIKENERSYRALQKNTEAIRNQAEASVAARQKLLQGQASSLSKLLTSGKLYTYQYEQVRDALKAVREELRQIEAATQRGGLSSKALFGLGNGTNDFSGIIASYQRFISGKQSATDATSHLSDAERKLAAAINGSTGAMKGQSSVLNDLKMMATQYLGVWGAQGFIRNIIEIGGQLEMQRLSIGAILGDMAKADDLFGKIKNLAVKSPFGVVELDQMTKQLSAYGFQYDELFDMTKRLADISAATGTSVDRLALALGHVRSEAALSGYTLRQFSMANIPLAKKLSEHLSEVEGKLVSIADVRKRVRNKEIGYEEVLNVLKELTDVGGMFYNAQEIMSESVKARFKNLKDSMDIMYGEIAESGFGSMLKEIATLLTTLTRHWEELGGVLVAAASYWTLSKLSMVASSKAMVQANLQTGQFTAAQLEAQAATGNLTRQQLLQAVASKKLSVDTAEAAAAVLGLSRVQLQAVATSGKASAAYNLMTAHMTKYGLAQIHALNQTKRISFVGPMLMRLQMGWYGVRAAAIAAATAVKTFAASMWPMLALSAIAEVFFSIRREQEEFADTANSVGQAARNMMKDIDDALNSIERDGKPVGTEALREAVKTMQDVVEQSEFYTIEQKNQVTNATELSEKYDVLLRQMKEMRAEASFLANSEDLFEKILENTGRRVVTNDSETYNPSTGKYERQQRLGGRFFNDSLKENMVEVSASNSQLEGAIQLLAEYQGVMEEAIKKNNGFGLSLDGKRWQEQIRLLAESGHWDEFVNSVEGAGSRFEKMTDKVKKASDDVRDKWDEVVTDDFEAIKLTLMEHFGFTEQELAEWAKNSEATVRWMVDGVVKAMSKFGIAESVLDSLKSKLLSFFNVTNSGKPSKRQPTPWDLQTELSKQIVGNIVRTSASNGKVLFGYQLVKEINEIVGTGEHEKTVSEVVKTIKERAQKDYQSMKDVGRIYGKTSKEYIAAKEKYDHSLLIAQSNGINESDIITGKYKDKKNKESERESERLAKLRVKQAEVAMKMEEDLAKQQRELEDALADARIAGIKNNGERERAEREEQFRKEERQIKLQVEEWKKAAYKRAKEEFDANNKDKTKNFYTDSAVGKAGWEAMGLTEEQWAIYEARMKEYLAKKARWEEEDARNREKANRDYINKYLKEYGDYAEKLKAIEENADAEIADIRREYGVNMTDEEKKAMEARIKTVEKGAEEEVEALNVQYGKVKAFLIDLYEDASKKSVGEIDRIIKKYEALVDFFGGKGGVTRKSLIDDFGFTESEIQMVADQMARGKKSVKDFVKQIQALKGELGQRSPWLQFKNNITEAFDKIKNATGENKNEDIGTGIAGIGTAVKAVLPEVESFGVAVANLFNTNDSGFRETISRLKEVGSVAEGIGKMYAGDYFGGAWQAIGGIVNIAGAFAEDKRQTEQEEYLRRQDKIRNAIEAATSSIDRLTGELEKSYGLEALRLEEEQKRRLSENQQRAIQALKNAGIGDDTFLGEMNGRAQLAAMIGARYGEEYDLLWSKIKYSKEMLDDYADDFALTAGHMLESTQISGLGGVGGLVGSWEELLNSNSPEKLAKLFSHIRKEDEELWGALTGYSDEMKEWLEALADSYDKLEEIELKAKEQITGTSFDNVYSSFMSSLNDLANGSEDVFEDVAANWQKMMNQMVLSNLIGENLKEELKLWYAAWDKAYRGDKDIDKDELESLRTWYNRIYDDFAGEVGRMKENGILNPLPTKEEQQEAKTYFANLLDSWKSTLTDLSKSTEDWKNELIDQVFGDLVESTILNAPFEVVINEWVTKFDDFGAYLEHWTKRYTDVIEDASLTEEQRIAQINALIEEQTGVRERLADKSKELAAGLGKEITEEFSNSLDNLGDTLIDALLDTEKDAEQVGKEIAQNLIKEMLTELLNQTEYADRIADIRQMWQDILSGKDTAHTLEDVLLEITALNNDIAEDESIKELAAKYQELGKAAEEAAEKADSVFKDLHSSFLDALTDMEGDVDSFRKMLEEKMLKDIIDKNILSKPFTAGLDGRVKDFKGIDDYIDQWTELYEAAAEAGNQELVDALLDELADVYNLTVEQAKDLRERMRTLTQDTTFTDMEDSFVSALMDMESDITDFADDMKKTIVQKLIESFMVSEKIKPMLDELQKTFDYVLGQKGWSNEQRLDFMIRGGIGGDGDHFMGIDSYEQDIKDLEATVDGLLTYAGFGKKTIDELLGSITSNLTTMLADGEKTAEDFSYSLKESIVNSLLEAYTATEEFQDGLAGIKQQMQEAIESGDPEQIKAAEQAAEDFYNNATAGVKAYTDAIKKAKVEQDTTFKDMGSELISALTDIDNDAEDWAKILGQKIADKIFEGMVGESQLLEKIHNAFNDAVSAATIVDADGNSYIDWQAVANNSVLKQAVTDSKAEFDELQKKWEELCASFGIELERSTKEGFSNLRGAFTESLYDIDATAETFGKQIGKTMAEQMVDAYLDSRYGSQMKTLNEEWAAALESGNTSALESIKQRVIDLYRTIANPDDLTLQGLLDAIREIETQLDTTFSGMGDSWASALMDMEKTAEDWAKDVGKIITEKIIKEMIVPTFIQPLLDELQGAMNSVLARENATWQDVVGVAQGYMGSISEAFNAWHPVVEQILNSFGIFREETEQTEEKIEYALGDLKSEFVSALMDVENTAEKFSESIGRTIAQAFIEKFVLGEAFDQQMKVWQQRFEDINTSGYSEDERMRQVKQLRDAITAAKEGYTSQSMAIQELLGLNAAGVEDQDAVANIADKITYEQADQLLGINMAMEMTLEQILATLRGSDAWSAIPQYRGQDALLAQQIRAAIGSQAGGDAIGTNSDIFNRLGYTNEYLRAIRDSNDAMLEQFGNILVQINARLARL